MKTTPVPTPDQESEFFAALSDTIGFGRAALDVWGKEHQIDIAIEEMAELIVALSHHRRGRATADDVADEVVDVLTVAVQMVIAFGFEFCTATLADSNRRLGDRLAVPAGELFADMLDDLPAPRLAFQGFRHHLAELVQPRAAALAAGAGRGFNNPFDR